MFDIHGVFLYIVYVGGHNMTTQTPNIDTSWELKWKRSLRKRLINCLARIENDGKPTQELQFELAKAKECFVYWNSDTALWEKHQMVVPITQPVPQATLQEPSVEPVKD